MNKNNLPENLYELRKRAGLSQEDFADKLGVSRQAVSKWERGEAYPDTENLIAISEMFDVTIDELLKSSRIHTESGEEPIGEDALSDACNTSNGAKSGVHVRVGGIAIDTDGCVNDDDDDDFDDDDEEDIARKNSKLSVWYTVPYPLVTTVVFLAIGLIFSGWYWAWTLFITIPIYYSLLDSIRKRSFAEFAYPVLATFLYCLLGMLLGWWHPGWLIFITIPIYYPIAEAIDRQIKRD